MVGCRRANPHPGPLPQAGASGRGDGPPFRFRGWRLALLVGAVVLVALWRFAVLVAGSTLDDAFILLVYARHFAESGQLYYHLADGHLDGFTSPLDLLIKAGAVRLFPRDPLFDIWVISLGLYLAVTLSVLWFALYAARQPPKPLPLRGARGARLVALLGLLGASSQSLAGGSQFLLETPLYTLLGIWAGYYFLVVKPPQSWPALLAFGGLLLALPLTRPEGLVVAGVGLGCFAVEQRRRLPRRRLLVPALVLGLGVAAYYVWRVRYFGYWAPNSYYAKTSASRLREIGDGLRYVRSYALSPALPAMAWLLVCPLFTPRFPTAELRRRYGSLCLVMLASLGTVIYGGGDCYSGGRFLALPLTLSTLAMLMVLFYLPVGPCDRAGLRSEPRDPLL